MPGGGTLGSIASSFLPVKTVDIGVPLLAMHSAVETMGAANSLCSWFYEKLLAVKAGIREIPRIH